MRQLFILCNAEVSNDNGSKFTVYYGYRQQQDKDGNISDVVTPTTDKDGKPAMKAIPIKVKLAEGFIKKVEKATFPLLLTLDTERKVTMNNEQKDSFYITVDKDKDKKARKDKYGKKHLILIIRDAEYTEMPRKSYSLDDLDTFEG